MVICGADTRPFPTILEHRLGYFKDVKMAWVQTPQWFYDLPKGEALDIALARKPWPAGGVAGRGIQAAIGPVQLGQDPFVSGPLMFYDIIQHRWNWANASFCCGAGSIHRQEAVMQAALRRFGDRVEARTHAAEEIITVSSEEAGISPVSAYWTDFFWHRIASLVMLELAMMTGTWGVSGFAAQTSFLAFFPLGLRAVFAVAKGDKIALKVTQKMRQSGNFLALVKPQIAIVGATVLAAVWAGIALSIEGPSHSATSVVSIVLWGFNNCLAMAGVSRAALWLPGANEAIE